MGRTPVYATPDEFMAKIEEYRKDCESKKEPVTLTGMVLYLGYKNKKSYYDQRDRTDNETENGPTWAEAVEYGSLLFEHAHEVGLHKGGNSGGHIFGLKNASKGERIVEEGWSDQTEHVFSGPDKGPIQYANLTDAELDAEIRSLAEETGLGITAEGEEKA